MAVKPFVSVCFWWWQHIRWKPTSPCKLWKLQYESHDVDPTGRSEEVRGVICKINFANHASHLPWILQITPSTSHKLSLGSRSCDSDWSFHSLHEEVSSTRYVPYYFNFEHFYKMHMKTISSRFRYLLWDFIYLTLFLITTYVGDIDTNLKCHFKLCFVIKCMSKWD
jgi:hypothetical protein